MDFRVAHICGEKEGGKCHVQNQDAASKMHTSNGR